MSAKYALIIANTDYNDPGLAKLSAPGRDAQEFERVLKSQDICGFDEVNILLNQSEPVVRDSIDAFFDQKKPDDLLVLYFSGHGVRDEQGALYLAVKNTNRFRLRATAIKSDFIRESMDQSHSKRQVLILDCCNSGAFAQGTKAVTGGSVGTASAFEGRGYGHVVLTASDSTQFAWEGNQVFGETQNSLFTHFLVKGLEGEADNDGDGRITINELYDYTYEQIVRLTPKQTPSKWSYKEQGEIALRESTRIEDIKPAPLPGALIDSLDNPFADVRLGAVQQLARLLGGRNLGLARSAREALDKIAAEDDSYRVRQAAAQISESLRQVAQKAEEERRARDEAEHIAILKAEEERLASEKVNAERKAKDETERLLRAKAEREVAESEAARLKAEREATEKATRVATEKAAKEKADKESAERKAALKAEREAMELASRKKAEREAAQKAEREAMELASRKKAEREAAEKAALRSAKAQEAGKNNKVIWESWLPKSPWLLIGIAGIVILAIVLYGFARHIFLPPLHGRGAAPTATSSQAASAGAVASSVVPVSAFGLGIVLPTRNEPRWIQDETRFNEAFKASGATVQVLFSDGDSAKEKANVESLISQGIKVLIICPQDATAAAAAVDEAHAAGVKVISYDRLILDSASVDYYVTFDSSSVGAAQGLYLVDHATGTQNPLYLYAGDPSDNNSFLFFEGAWEALQPKIADGTFVIKNSDKAVGLQTNARLTRDQESTIISQITTKWDGNVARSLAEANLTAARAADKGNVFILAPNDSTARSIIDPFRADKDVLSYVITGQDAEEASIQYIIDGRQSMTVLKDVRTLVNDAIAVAQDFLAGRTPPQNTTYNNGRIDVPARPSLVITVDKSNIRSTIIDSGYWPATDFINLP